MFVPLFTLCLVGGLQAGPGLPIGGSLAGMDSATMATTTAAWTKPWFCHKLECPKYTVLETNSNYEKRLYEPSVWVASEVTTSNFDANGYIINNRELFYKDFHYIAGSNSAHMKIPMTAPVLMEIDLSATSRMRNFTEYFMVPFNLQDNPPAPTEAGVFIARKPAMTVYVRQYSGYSSNDLKSRNTQSLMSDLTAAGKSFRQDVVITAGYDGPYTFTERHNEVWVIAM